MGWKKPLCWRLIAITVHTYLCCLVISTLALNFCLVACLSPPIHHGSWVTTCGVNASRFTPWSTVYNMCMFLFLWCQLQMLLSYGTSARWTFGAFATSNTTRGVPRANGSEFWSWAMDAVRASRIMEGTSRRSLTRGKGAAWGRRPGSEDNITKAFVDLLTEFQDLVLHVVNHHQKKLYNIEQVFQ